MWFVRRVDVDEKSKVILLLILSDWEKNRKKLNVNWKDKEWIKEKWWYSYIKLYKNKCRYIFIEVNV